MSSHRLHLQALLLLGSLLICCAQHSQYQSDPGRSTIAQLFEWRFDDIALECEQLLARKGYSAVQVSPINEHLVFEGRPWWERYQPISYRIQSRSGTEQQFASMTRRCNAMGIRVYVDVVLNHMAGVNPPPIVGTANSTADPAKFSYPGVPFAKKHFHAPCQIEDWNGAHDLRNCEVNKLRDLNQSLPYVRQQQVAYLNRLVQLGAAGFRVDAAKHMWPKDLYMILSAVDNLSVEHGFAPDSRPFVILEIVDFGSAPGELGRWEYRRLGKITDFLVPGEYGRHVRGFSNLADIQNFGPLWTFLSSNLSIVFLTDHEIQRGQGQGGHDILTYRDAKMYKMATAFMLAHPLGTPRILSSYHYENVHDGPPADERGNILTAVGCTNNWVCEHRWLAVANMVEFRLVAGAAEYSNWWDNGLKQIAFSRGDRAFVAINGHMRWDFEWELQTCLPAGRYCDVVTGEAVLGECSGEEVVVDALGVARIRIAATSEDGFVAIHVGRTSALARSSQRTDYASLLRKYATTECFWGMRKHLQELKYY